MCIHSCTGRHDQCHTIVRINTILALFVEQQTLSKVMHTIIVTIIDCSPFARYSRSLPSHLLRWPPAMVHIPRIMQVIRRNGWDHATSRLSGGRTADACGRFLARCTREEFLYWLNIFTTTNVPIPFIRLVLNEYRHVRNITYGLEVQHVHVHVLVVRVDGLTSGVDGNV